MIREPGLLLIQVDGHQLESDRRAALVDMVAAASGAMLTPDGVDVVFAGSPDRTLAEGPTDAPDRAESSSARQPSDAREDGPGSPLLAAVRSARENYDEVRGELAEARRRAAAAEANGCQPPAPFFARISS